MAFKSALGDFRDTTLGAVPGLLGKLHYLAGIHDGHGGYSHWGMGRVYGVEAARRAIQAAHSALFAQLLRTPLRTLDEDVKYSALARQLTPLEFLASLRKLAPQALPDRSVTSSEKHFMAVLHALSALMESQARANRLGASLPRPPGR